MPRNKPAKSSAPLHSIIAQRWSPRAFTDQVITPEEIRSLLEAARWASSCFNDQPGYFLVASKEDPEAFKKLLDCLVPANQEWSKNAPLLMISLARNTFEYNGKPNDYAMYDCGQSVSSMMIQASSMGISAHQMGGIEKDKIRQAYELPDNVTIGAAIALGRQGDESRLSENTLKAEGDERVRRPVEENSFGSKWGSKFL